MKETELKPYLDMAEEILEEYTRAYSEMDKKSLAEYIRSKFEELLINNPKSNNSEVMRNKQIEEMAKVLTKYEYSLCERLPKDKCLLTSAIHAQVSCDYCKIAEHLYNAGYRKQSEEIEKCRERIFNQREELRRLNKRITDLTQSREVWKKQAERVGKQLHEVLSKQSELTPCDVCRFNPPSSKDGKPCSVCPAQAKMKGGAE